ncbi:MAG: DUF255 domain-containing protein [Elusimicrobia bacterium]|nr:DUF255 domain-containing protein [Elusimicrobiota bacterium]
MKDPARGKEIHRRVMMMLGLMITAFALAAAYLAFGPGGSMPPLFFGHWRRLGPPSGGPVVRIAKHSEMRWRSLTSEVLEEARKRNCLILLHLASPSSRASQVQEEVFNDSRVESWIEGRAIAVKEDLDERPDLQLRFGAGLRASLALITPSGEVLGASAAGSPGLFLNWARALEAAYRRNPAAIDAALKKRREGARFRPPLDSAVLGPEDPVWGGVHRSAVEYEKLLADQARTLEAESEPQRASRALSYVRHFLSAPAGGYFNAQTGELLRPDGRIVEGRYYFSLPEAKRRGLGIPAVDKRLFAAPNAAMAASVLASPHARGQDREQALKTLRRWRQEDLLGGCVVHRLGGPASCFLQDQTAMGEAFLTGYQRTGDPAYLKACVAIFRGAERHLADPVSRGLRDRPGDGVLIPALNADAGRFYLKLAQALPRAAPEKGILLAWGGSLLRLFARIK